MAVDLETAACVSVPVRADGFNAACVLPHGLTTEHVRLAIAEFTDFLGFINTQLRTKGIDRFEVDVDAGQLLVSRGRSSSKSSIPKHCPTLAANTYHNGHPDLVPAGLYPGNAAQHVEHGIEVKGSRYLSGWQAHIAEDTWLMVFVFDASRGTDAAKSIAPRPFRFLQRSSALN